MHTVCISVTDSKGTIPCFPNNTGDPAALLLISIKYLSIWSTMLSRLLFLPTILLLSVLGASASESYYCASVNVAVGGTVSTESDGFFAMKIGDGYAKYNFNVDLSGTDVCDFTTYPMVSYHIHTYTVNNSAVDPVNSCANTQGHFDPSLACSEKSQAHAGSCTTLGRINADAYVYTCTAAAGTVAYTNTGANCEAGDLSGKLGKVAPSTTTHVAASTQVYTDYMPPYNANYRTDSTLTTGWASIVFHCGDSAGTRIACGNFQVVPNGYSEDSLCSFDGDAWVNNESCNDDDDGIALQTGEFAIVITVLVVGWVIAMLLCAMRFFWSKPNGSGDTARLTNKV